MAVGVRDWRGLWAEVFWPFPQGGHTPDPQWQEVKENKSLSQSPHRKRVLFVLDGYFMYPSILSVGNGESPFTCPFLDTSTNITLSMQLIKANIVDNKSHYELLLTIC